MLLASKFSIFLMLRSGTYEYDECTLISPLLKQLKKSIYKKVVLR